MATNEGTAGFYCEILLWNKKFWTGNSIMSLKLSRPGIPNEDDRLEKCSEILRTWNQFKHVLWFMNSRSGRPRTGRSQQNIDRVQQLLIDNPRGISGRRNGLGLPHATFSRIISKDLKWHPDKTRMRHELNR